jgi:hypothetical protein
MTVSSSPSFRMCFRFETFMRTPFLLLIICCSSVFAQQLPPAPKAHVVDVTPNAGYFNEPAIAVNPKDPQQAVVAWQVPASAAYSHDGGETWKIAEGTAPGMYRVSGDVSLAYDAAGHAILCYIAFDKLGSTNYWARGATRNGIFIRRSLDGGQTWEHDARTVISHESTPDIPFEDKPWIVADTAGPHAGNLYIGWTHFTLAASELMFSRSTDDGITWSQPIKLSSVPGLPRDDNGALEGFHGVVGPDGALYTIWDARDGIMMAVSHDGGASFRKIGSSFLQVQATSGSLAFRAPTAFPRLAWIFEEASMAAICTLPGVITLMAMSMFSFRRRATTAKAGACRCALTPILSIMAMISFFNGWRLTLRATQ